MSYVVLYSGLPFIRIIGWKDDDFVFEDRTCVSRYCENWFKKGAERGEDGGEVVERRDVSDDSPPFVTTVPPPHRISTF